MVVSICRLLQRLVKILKYIVDMIKNTGFIYIYYDSINIYISDFYKNLKNIYKQALFLKISDCV